MADKSIEQLNAAEKVYLSDLFVLQQSGTAKKLTGQVLKNWLLELAQGHGGITSIALQSTSGLNKTYRITLADDTYFDMTVADGKGITSVAKTGTSGLVDTYTMKFNAGSDFVFTVKNGEKGDKGDADRLYFKFASQKPTDASHNMGDVPDEWLGFYAGTTPPSGWQDYTWVHIKGDKGDKGDAATLTSHSTTYMVSDSGTVVPSGSWVADVPNVPQGKYLWTKTVLTFNTGSPVTSYSVSRFGIDGSGAVSSVNDKNPDPTGNVKLTSADIPGSSGQSIASELDAKAGADALTDAVKLLLPLQGGIMTGNIDLGGNALTNVKAPAAATDAATKGYVDGKRLVLTTTIPASWTGSAEPYTQTISVPGILATDTPHIMPVYTDPDYSVTLAQIEGWSKIVSAFSGDGVIAFYCRPDKPTVAIPIQIEVMR
nr:MAG TPA: tail protein [Caudoviricetes sp.]